MGFIIFCLWAAVVLRVLSILLSPLAIGEPRPTITGGQVALQSLFNVFWIVVFALAAILLQNSM